LAGLGSGSKGIEGKKVGDTAIASPDTKRREKEISTVDLRIREGGGGRVVVCAWEGKEAERGTQSVTNRSGGVQGVEMRGMACSSGNEKLKIIIAKEKRSTQGKKDDLVKAWSQTLLQREAGAGEYLC